MVSPAGAAGGTPAVLPDLPGFLREEGFLAATIASVAGSARERPFRRFGARLTGRATRAITHVSHASPSRRDGHRLQAGRRSLPVSPPARLPWPWTRCGGALDVTRAGRRVQDRLSDQGSELLEGFRRGVAGGRHSADGVLALRGRQILELLPDSLGAGRPSELKCRESSRAPASGSHRAPSLAAT